MVEKLQTQSDESSKISHLGMFTFLWVIALLWHYYRRPVDYSEFWVLLIPSVLVLTRPKNALFIITMALGFVYIFFYELPASSKPNHPTLQMLINLSIAGAGLWVLIRNYIETKTWHFDKELWFDTFRPLVIIAINIVYLMAVFNKLNTAFFDPEISDVTRLLNFYYEADHLLFIPDLMPRATWFLYFGIIATLVIETAIPLMLWIRPLRLSGIFLGLVFHTILSIRLYPSMAEFPTLLFAVYILALPDTTIPMLIKLWQRVRQQSWFIPARNFAIVSVAWFFFLLPMVFQWPQQGEKLLFTHEDVWAYTWVAYLVIYYAMIIYLYVKTRGGFKEPKDIRWFQPRNAILMIFPIVIFLNGLTPYLGIKNKGSWNMYSGLRTEAGFTNHLFMPNLYITPYMKEVCIVDSSVETLRRSYFTGELFTIWDLIRFGRNHPEAKVRFFMDGKIHNLDPIGDYPEYSRDLNWFEENMWIVHNGRGFEAYKWCQQYKDKDIDPDTLPNVTKLDDYHVILWEPNAQWSLDDEE